MNTKKIIIVLLIVVVILSLTLYIINTLKRNVPIVPEGTTVLPTAVIIPTRDIPQGGFDIIAVEPADQTTNIPLDQKITITFSRPYHDNEITFSLSPATPFISDKEGNKLIITPQSTWQPGTPYAYSVNFSDNNQKVRLYRFYTTGPTQEFLPDTQPEGLYEKEEAKLKENYTDYYVNNNTPYKTDTFSVVSEFNPDPPEHFYFIVTSKIDNQDKTKSDFNLWLQSLDLSDEQISKLDIQYK